MIAPTMMKLLITVMILSSISGCDKNSAKSPESTALSISQEALKPAHSIKKAQVEKGQGLYQALTSLTIDNAKALLLIDILSDEVEFSKLKVGDQLEATFDQSEKLVKFSFSQNPVETHSLTLNADTQKWEYSLTVQETVSAYRMIEGELQESSNLQADLLAQGLKLSVVNEVVNVLLCKVNFRTNARTGDRYSVLLSEKKYQDMIVGTKVLYTSYQGVRAGDHEAFFYEDGEKNSTFTAHYTESGEALISSGLRYPLPKLHVRSAYGMRIHPVTGMRAMHNGVDLKAGHGAAVHAVAEGKVVESGFGEYAGNFIGIRHKDGSTSYYYHLASRGVNKGATVRTHQVIGKVGATGRVTGAHLHFGFKDPSGKWMNPMNKRMIATPKLAGQKFDNLKMQIAQIKGTLADLKLSKESEYILAKLHFGDRTPGSVDDFSFIPTL
jgi:murein DD-endopeptidase MepM/ murein hydrolase activator NlpD